MFKNQKIRFRILLGYSVPLFLFVLVALVVYASLRSYAKVHDITIKGNTIVAKSKDLSFNLAKMERSVRGYLLYKNEISRNSCNEAEKEIKKTIQAISPLIKDEKQQELFGRILLKIDEESKIASNFILLVDKGETDKAIASFREGASIKLGSDLEDMTNEFENKVAGLLETWQVKEESALGKIGTALMIGILLTLTLSAVISLLIANGITRH